MDRLNDRIHVGIDVDDVALWILKKGSLGAVRAKFKEPQGITETIVCGTCAIE